MMTDWPYPCYCLIKESFNKKEFFCLLFACIVFSLISPAQEKIFTAANAHAHNDYLHPVPFYTAYHAGFGSIEVDIFPVNGILCVAHSKNEIQPHRTLKGLYLDPLVKELAKNNNRHLKLLIDIKENYALSLQILIKDLEPLKQYLSRHQQSQSLIILISGSRPPPAEYKNYPDYIFFDDDLKLAHSAEEWKRVGQVSLPFVKFSAWKGQSKMDPKEETLLKQKIDSVHAAGKTIRFWASPDNESSWTLQMKSGVDLIGTDKINELNIFLRSRSHKE